MHLQAARSDWHCYVCFAPSLRPYDLPEARSGSAVPTAGFQGGELGVAPPQTHRFRSVFNPVHHWLGRFALVFAIISVYLGLHLSDVPPPPPPRCYFDLVLVIPTVISGAAISWLRYVGSHVHLRML